MSASIRKTKTGSGATAVQVVRYERRRVVVLKHIGSGHSVDEVAALVDSARQWIARSTLQEPLFAPESRRSLALATTRYVGVSHAFAYAVLRACAKRCGLDALEDELLTDLALMRLVEPTSKLRAIELLERYFTRRYSQRSVYRALPKLNRHKEALETLAMDYAKNVLGASVQLVLYDVTTLYFESFKADELRVPGFSKDGKAQQPQIVLGLLVTNTGFPLGYEVFAGNTFEGKTILPVLRAFMARHATKDLVVVADAAMLSEKVLKEIGRVGMSYIVGARLANSPPPLIQRISEQLGQRDNAIIRVPSKHGDMVCAFSSKRFKKDQATMQQQLVKAQALVVRREPGRRAKFVTHAQGREGYMLDEKLLAKTQALLGVKGYCTNLPEADLSNQEVIARYHDLWQVEKAFRMAKSDLATRPIYHRTQEAVLAHVLICFTALMVGRSMEIATGRSIRRIIDAIWGVTDAKLIDTATGEEFIMRSPISDETKSIITDLGLSY